MDLQKLRYKVMDLLLATFLVAVDLLIKVKASRCMYVHRSRHKRCQRPAC